MPLIELGLGKVGARMDGQFVGEEASGGTYVTGDEKLEKVFVSGLDPVVPRRVRTLAGSKAQTQVVQTFLASRGLKTAKARVTLVVQADLDGDGTQEVIIEARSRNDTAGNEQAFTKADYSLVLLRCLEGKKLRQRALRLLSFQKDQFLETTRLRAIADLDGDGRMEIITSGQGYEWQNAQLWSYRSGKVTKLLENGAGV